MSSKTRTLNGSDARSDSASARVPPSYPIVEIEVSQPLPEMAIPAGCDGLALVVRRRGRPVGFLMNELASASVLSRDELAELISAECGQQLLEEAVREELAPDLPSRSPLSVSVAICTKDRPALLRRCLASVTPFMAASGEEGRRIEILVVDNAPSDDRVREVTESFSGVRYVREPKAGLNFARNRAVREATGEILAFLDDDAVADRFWLDGLHEAIRENPDAAAFTGLVLPYELTSPAQVMFEKRGGFRRGFQKIRFHPRALPGNNLYPCGAGSFGAGCNMAFQRDVLLELGGFDEALDTGAPLPGGGDLDIFYRVVRAGHVLVYEPQFLVFHEHRRELAKLRRQYWSWGLGFMAFCEKSFRTDPDLRQRLRRMRRWWFSDQMYQLARSVAGRHSVPPRMIVAEFIGGMMGMTGTYRRSQRRTDRIRARAHE